MSQQKEFKQGSVICIICLLICSFIELSTNKYGSEKEKSSKFVFVWDYELILLVKDIA